MKSRMAMALVWGWCCVAVVAAESGVNGRHVRLEIPVLPAVGEDKRDMYRMMEIEVFSGGVNVARQGKVTSSVAGGPGGSRLEALIDGDNRDFTNSACSLPPQANPWIEIDLGQTAAINRIHIYTKGGSFNKSPLMWLVSVLDADRKVVWYRRMDLIAAGRLNSIVPKSFTGRYTGQILPVGGRGWYAISGELENERNLRVTVLDLGPAPELAQRQADFKQRDADAAVADLCRRFHAAADPDAKGLERFKKAYGRGEYRRALEAYREFFFDRLANPEKYGIPADLSKSVSGEVSDMTVDTIAAGEAMNNRRVSKQGTACLVGEVGPPGATRWTPREPEPAREIPTTELNFFRMPEHTYAPRFTMFNDLLKSYVASGNKDHLGRWLDYLDDWCLHGRADILNSRLNLAMAAEPSPTMIFSELMRWRFFLQHRPEFARDFRSTSLARYLLSLVEDLPPFGIRARRAELANWGAGGTYGLAASSILLPEFRAMRYFARESARLAMSSFIQHRTLDGENIEAGDEGHRHSDTGMKEVLNVLPLLPLDPALGLGDQLIGDYAEDLLLPFYRNLLTRISPEGYDWPCWSLDPAGKPAMDFEGRQFRLSHTAMELLGHGRESVSLKRPMPSFADFVKKEPEAAARMAAVMGYPTDLWLKFAANGDLPYMPPEAKLAVASAREKAKTTGLPPPERTSDAAPYSAMYFLRDKWQPGDEYFMLLSFLARSQDHDQWAHPRAGGILGYGAMRYDLMKEGRTLVSSECIVIDKKAPNAWHDAIPTGGKTAYCAMAGRHVVDTRFHTSTRFDLAEARRNDPYSRPERVRGDWYNIWTRRPQIDNTPITGVTAFRQVFHVKGEGVWIVSDRIEGPSGKPHEFSTFWTYPAWVNPKGLAQSIRELAASGHRLVVEEQGRVRTAIPGYANISSRFFGPDFRMINRLDPNGQYVTIDKPQITLIKEALDKGASEADIMLMNGEASKLLSMRQVGILWKGTGNQSLVTLHYTREPVAEPSRQLENDLREIQELKAAGGVTGFRAVTRTGAVVGFQSGPQRANALSAGPASVKGESLMVVERDGALSGIVLGTDRKITLRGKTYPADAADFEYILGADGKFSAAPIYRAIDTAKIAPEQNVFTDQAEISFSIPTQKADDIEFRYTLDGSDPTLESALYTKPFTIAKDTYVKVRPFRKGLARTPWNSPDERAGKTVGAIFRKQPPRPALKVAATEPGLAYEYFEALWPTLFTHAAVPGVLDPKRRGKTLGLLDPKEVEAIRATDKACAIRYNGYIQVPSTGVYSLRAPEHLYTPTMDAGYDLRVFIDGEEWFPSPALHSENVWHIALEAGLHRLAVTYVDYRWKQFKNEYWMEWQERQMWQGTPALEITGPGAQRQPIPSAWLRH